MNIRHFFVSIYMIFISGCDLKNGTDDPTRQLTVDSGQQKLVEPQQVLESPSEDIAMTPPTQHHWWQDAVIYQIFPRSFHDADGDGNGDFEGIIAKLPYLKDLGVGAIWLTPVFASPSYHGYDTTNFYEVESDFGSLDDFERLLKQSESMGIKVILDLVINHVSDQHPWFLKSIEEDPTYADYFLWSDTLPSGYGLPWSTEPDPTRVWHTKAGRNGWYYGTFGYQQPDLNLSNPKVTAEIKDIAAYWLNKGVDGFRLDAVRHLIEEGGIPLQSDTNSTFEFLADFNQFVKKQKPDAYLIGEAFIDTPSVAKYFNGGAGIDAAFDFDFAFNVGVPMEVDKTGIPKSKEETGKEIGQIKDALWNNLAQRAEKKVPLYFFAPFVSNHDVDRLAARTENNATKAKIAAALLLTSPGTPFIYYGEEIGMAQISRSDDLYRRAIMQWDNSQNAGFNINGERWIDNSSWFPWLEKYLPWWNVYWQYKKSEPLITVQSQLGTEESILSFYKRLIRLRNTEIVLRRPERVEFFSETGNAWVVKYIRKEKDLWVLLNLDSVNDTLFVFPGSAQDQYLDVFSGQHLPGGGNILLSKGELKILERI